MWSQFVALRGAALRGSIRKMTVGFAVAAICSGGLVAQAAAADMTPTPYGTDTWAGLNWGLGIAADFDVTGARVAAATLTGPTNIVRITDATPNVDVGFVLEAHYFIRDYLFAKPIASVMKGIPCDQYCNFDVADGPFVALEIGNGTSVPSGNSGPITGYALGWMVGLHHPVWGPSKTNPSTLVDTSTRSWNLGIGLRVDPNAQVLGDGIVANQPLPAGETTIRYEKEARYGIMLLSSFSF
jgi:hypothetical protein